MAAGAVRCVGVVVPQVVVTLQTLGLLGVTRFVPTVAGTAARVTPRRVQPCELVLFVTAGAAGWARHSVGAVRTVAVAAVVLQVSVLGVCLAGVAR